MDNQYSSFYLYKKYEVIGDELIDLGITSIDADGTQEPVMKEECDSACGCIEPQYRWVVVPGGYECSGTTKMTQEKEQVSLDSGVTWNDVSPLTTRAALPVIEQYSQDCGYVPLTRWLQTENTVCVQVVFNGKYRLDLIDGSVITAACDSTSSITQTEMSKYGTTQIVKVGDCVTSIGGKAFSGNTCLLDVELSDSVTTIGSQAFYDTSLTKMRMSNNVTSIGSNAFAECYNFLSIGAIGSNYDIELSNSITDFGTYAFYNCSGLEGAYIPNGITNIGNYGFYMCKNLRYLTIPDSVTSIGSSAFHSCTSLYNAYIGSGITSIGNRAFRYCSGLTFVRILATTPPTLGTDVFRETNNCPIYVPATSVNTYKTATGWSDYASRIQALPNS